MSVYGSIAKFTNTTTVVVLFAFYSNKLVKQFAYALRRINSGCQLQENCSEFVD